MVRGGKQEPIAWQRLRFLPRRFWYRDLAVVTDQLADLAGCNVPLPEGIDRAAGDAPNEALKELLHAMAKDMAGGLMLHESMARYPVFFPKFYVDVVQAGEQTGQLEEAFRNLADDLFETMQFRDRFQAHVMYVGLVLGIECMLFIGLFVFVLPQFETIYKEFDSDLPPVMKLVSHLMRMDVVSTAGLVVLLALLVLWAIHHARALSRPMRLRVSRVWLAFPILGGIMVKKNLAHACAVLARLLEAGVPLPRALESTAALDLAPVYSEAFQSIAGNVAGGHRMSEEVSRHGRLFPGSFHTMTALGESSGKLAEAFQQLGSWYRRDVLRRSRIALDIAAPIAICDIGVVVFMVYLAFWTCILQLPGLIQID